MKQIYVKNGMRRLRSFCLALFVAAAVLVVPVQKAQAAERELVPMGNTVGIQIRTEGVLVVGLSATGDGTSVSPAAVAGLLPGDIIIALGDEKISSADDFRAALEKLDGSAFEIRYQRGGEEHKTTIEPIMTEAGIELGLWLRDRVSGIGTLTYFDPQTGGYGGLGHSINDVDSGVILPLSSGEILESSVDSVVKGVPGAPGELRGGFDIQNICGSIDANTINGIFGKLTSGIPDVSGAIPIGGESEIVLGKANILANVSGTEICEYEIEIVRVYRDEQANRNIMIKVTDARLLEKTGGIVQGMSGSPIIQNGRLIGAVTHVMVNDPSSGYGISIQKMLSAGENSR